MVVLLKKVYRHVYHSEVVEQKTLGLVENQRMVG